MDNPIFKLEKVVQTRGSESLEDFEGPLDLILFLLSKNKIEIQDIPIALILEQYLDYLEKRKQMDLEVASEFITMAAHLMYIKTRMLLSLEDLILAMQEVTDRRGQPEEAPPLKAFDEIVKREPYPVETKAREIIRRLKESGITRFLLLFRGSRTRSELVATFMAVLELCRNNLIKLAGPAGDCTVACGDEGAEELM